MSPDTLLNFYYTVIISKHMYIRAILNGLSEMCLCVYVFIVKPTNNKQRRGKEFKRIQKEEIGEVGEDLWKIYIYISYMKLLSNV